MVDAATCHGYYIMLKFFNEKIAVLPESPMKKAISRLGLLTALFYMKQVASQVFAAGAADQEFFESAYQTYEN